MMPNQHLLHKHIHMHNRTNPKYKEQRADQILPPLPPSTNNTILKRVANIAQKIIHQARRIIPAGSKLLTYSSNKTFASIQSQTENTSGGKKRPRKWVFDAADISDTQLMEKEPEKRKRVKYEEDELLNKIPAQFRKKRNKKNSKQQQKGAGLGQKEMVEEEFSFDKVSHQIKKGSSEISQEIDNFKMVEQNLNRKQFTQFKGNKDILSNLQDKLPEHSEGNQIGSEKVEEKYEGPVIQKQEEFQAEPVRQNPLRFCSIGSENHCKDDQMNEERVRNSLLEDRNNNFDKEEIPQVNEHPSVDKGNEQKNNKICMNVLEPEQNILINHDNPLLPHQNFTNPFMNPHCKGLSLKQVINDIQKQKKSNNPNWASILKPNIFTQNQHPSVEINQMHRTEMNQSCRDFVGNNFGLSHPNNRLINSFGYPNEQPYSSQIQRVGRRKKIKKIKRVYD